MHHYTCIIPSLTTAVEIYHQLNSIVKHAGTGCLRFDGN